MPKTIPVSANMVSARIANLASDVAREAINVYRQKSFQEKKKLKRSGTSKKKEDISKYSEAISLLHDRIEYTTRVADALELPGKYSDEVRNDLRNLTGILYDLNWTNGKIKAAYKAAALKVDKLSRHASKVKASELQTDVSGSDSNKRQRSALPERTKPKTDNHERQPVRFNVLFLSDLHWSVQHRDRWNIIEGNFLTSIKNAIKDAGPIDLIVFGGDLVSTGVSEEYEGPNSVGNFLDRLRKTVSNHLVDVPFLVVPGNHDVRRQYGPKPGDGELKEFLLRQQQHAFEVSSDESNFIKHAFENYSAWNDKIIKGQLEKCLQNANYTKGILPGDFSCSIAKADFKVGIVGLNSTYLQLHAGKLRRLLHIDAKQLLQVTGENCDHWLKSNDLNLLITHHPPDWFSVESEQTFNDQIFNPKWFGIHLHGHMHETQWKLKASSPASPLQYVVQCPSLLSNKQVEHEDGKMSERVTGYCVLQLVPDASGVTFRIRPQNLDKAGHEIYPPIPDLEKDGWTKPVRLARILREIPVVADVAKT